MANTTTHTPNNTPNNTPFIDGYTVALTHANREILIGGEFLFSRNFKNRWINHATLDALTPWQMGALLDRASARGSTITIH